MHAIGYHRPLPITDPAALVDLDLPRPVPTGRDLLVEVHAVSVNPVDTKIRRSAGAAPPEGSHRVLGWDAAGVVAEVGPQVTAYRPGDAVYYAGALNRPGTNSRFHLVDERVVGRKPASLDFAAAAAMPLTGITAWELLFERLAVRPGKGGPRRSLLIIGGAGGVGSMLIQLAARLANLTVVATASRPETHAWCRELGAHHVIDHTQPMPAQLAALGLPHVDLVIGCTATDKHWAAIVEVVAPQGHVALIDDPQPIDVRQLKRKSVALHWELMFTRTLFDTPDIEAQRHLLDEIAALTDAGVLRSTITTPLGKIDAANLKQAHALIESGTARGKVVLAGW